jgi:AcrR family transcriptional regulator
MADTALRDRKARETRARIAKAALELFINRGFTETSFDQIAEAAGVGRRTIFDHFRTKEAILFDHLVVRHEVAIQRLRDRPSSEPLIKSLHAVTREMCEQGYDRELLALIRTVLKSEPRLAYAQLSIGIRAFENGLVATLEGRDDSLQSSLVIRALTLMALSWVDAANRTFLFEGKRSLIEYFDDVVETCLCVSTEDLKASLDFS